MMEDTIHLSNPLAAGGRPVLIVGGGLAGMTAARLLHRAGIGFQLLEARSRLGGRILSADAAGEASADGFDLGPSWFWPGMQPAMARLVEELGLADFPQNSDGDVIYQRTPQGIPQRYHGMRQEPPSMRLVGGTGVIISAIASSLPQTSIRLGARVTQVALNGQGVKVGFTKANGTEQTLDALHVLLALPPRLVEATVSFSPGLDVATARRWRAPCDVVQGLGRRSADRNSRRQAGRRPSGPNPPALDRR